MIRPSISVKALTVNLGWESFISTEGFFHDVSSESIGKKVEKLLGFRVEDKKTQHVQYNERNHTFSKVCECNDCPIANLKVGVPQYHYCEAYVDGGDFVILQLQKQGSQLTDNANGTVTDVKKLFKMAVKSQKTVNEMRQMTVSANRFVLPADVKEWGAEKVETWKLKFSEFQAEVNQQ